MLGIGNASTFPFPCLAVGCWRQIWRLDGGDDKNGNGRKWTELELNP